MGILSYFGKQTFTLYVSNRSGYFEDKYDSELWFRLDYQSMRIHQNSHKGWGEDFDDLPHYRDLPARKVIKTSTDLRALIQYADEFNEEQEKHLNDRVHLRISENNLSERCDCPFPIDQTLMFLDRL